MTRWECFKMALDWLWLTLAPSRIRRARTGKAIGGRQFTSEEVLADLEASAERLRRGQ